MQLMYELFVKHHNEYMDREAPKYLVQSAALAEVMKAEGLDSPATYELRKKVDHSNVNMRRELMALEDWFIDSLEAVLAESQIERAVLLRDEAKRRNHRTFRTYGRWRDIELRQVWEQHGANDASPGEAELVESFLADHERRLTVLICRQSDYEYEARLKLADNRMARLTGASTPHNSMAVYERIMAKRRNLAERVRLLHEQTMRNIVAVISPALAEHFRGSACQLAYPEIYPDPDELHQLFVAVTADQSVEASRRAAAAAVLEEYTVAHMRMCKDMESLCNEWAEMTEGGISGYEPQFLGAALQPLIKERDQLSQRYMRTLEEIVGADLVSLHKSRVMPPINPEPLEVIEDTATTSNP